MYTDLMGFLATLASLTIIVVGLPAQIIKNYQKKSADGIQSFLVWSIFVTYSLWTLYSWAKPDWFMVVAQTPGCVLSLILLFQLYYYKKRTTCQGN